jgi:hypothetical protein
MEKPQEFVERLVSQQVAGFDDSRKFYRGGHFKISIITALLSAGTTVLISLGETYDWYYATIALFTSAAITVVAAWNAFFQYRELWIQKTDAWMELSKLQSNIEFAKAKSGGTIPEQDLQRFYERFEAIVMNEHELWKKLRSTQTVEPGSRNSGN